MNTRLFTLLALICQLTLPTNALAGNPSIIVRCSNATDASSRVKVEGLYLPPGNYKAKILTPVSKASSPIGSPDATGKFRKIFTSNANAVALDPNNTQQIAANMLNNKMVTGKIINMADKSTVISDTIQCKNLDTNTASCTGKVADFFKLASGSYTANASTFDSDNFSSPPPTTVAGFNNGTSYTVTVNANCTITAGTTTFSYKDGSYYEFPGSGVDTGKTQYDIDLTGPGMIMPHFERFTNGKRGLSFFDPVHTSYGARIDEP